MCTTQALCINIRSWNVQCSQLVFVLHGGAGLGARQDMLIIDDKVSGGILKHKACFLSVLRHGLDAMEDLGLLLCQFALSCACRKRHSLAIAIARAAVQRCKVGSLNSAVQPGFTTQQGLL